MFYDEDEWVDTDEGLFMLLIVAATMASIYILPKYANYATGILKHAEPFF